MTSTVREIYTVINSTGSSQPSVLSLFIDAKHSWSRYRGYRHAHYTAPSMAEAIAMPKYLWRSNDEWLYRTARAIWFADVTGLRPIDGPIPSRHRSIPWMSFSDHTSYWEAADGTPFVLTEPYISKENYQVAMNNVNDVVHIVSPVPIAPYNGGHNRTNPETISILLTAPSFGGALSKIERKLQEVDLSCSPWKMDSATSTSFPQAKDWVHTAKETL